MAGTANTHILSVLVQNKPGVLARIAGLISRRGYNIESLAVGPTESPEMSRITLQVNVEDVVLEQITKQLNKLVPVIRVAGDIAKMIGYPVGVWWRLRNKPPKWQ